MKGRLNEIDWSTKLCDMNVEEMWNEISNTLYKLREEFIPVKKCNPKAGKRKTVPQTVLDKIRTKRKAFKNYKKYQTPHNYKAYTRARNQVKWAMRKSVKDREISLAKSIKTNPKAFYDYISSMSKRKDGVANLSKPGGSLTESDMEKAEVLNTFFSSVFTREDTDNIPSFPSRSDATITTITVTEEDIKKKLDNICPSKACGPDDIHPQLLKELSQELARPLCILFEKSMSEGTIPKCWKCAEVKPIFKKGDKSNPKKLPSSQFDISSF